jgi:hypothetical protein
MKLTGISKNAFIKGGVLIGVAAISFMSARSASAVQLITNGDFETGDFTGWNVTDLAGSSGSFYIDDNNGGTPISGNSTVGAAGGNFYAVSDQGGPGTHVLWQNFTVLPQISSAILSFDMFVNDWSNSGGIINPVGLNHTSGANQHARVDILAAGSSPFDTGAGVLGSFYLGVDSGTNPHPYKSYSFDVTSLVQGGGNFILRFGEADNQMFLNQGIDNVSLQAQPVPEPTTMLGTLAFSALGGGALLKRKRKKVS